MRILTRILLFSLMSIRPARAETQTAHTFTGTKAVGYEYLLSLPTDYATAPEKHWPVLLFLHGAGERGAKIWQVAGHGPPKLLRAEVSPAASAGATPAAPTESAAKYARRAEATKQLKENFIVISPHCPAGTSWNDDAVLAVLDHVMATHRTDATRVYLTGLSMGGYATWSLATRYPERFAAAVPICGGGQTIDIHLAAGAKLAALRSLPVRAYHGAKDPSVMLVESERMVAEMKKYGVTDVTLTVYPDATHDSWTETYDNPELYAWLLQHTRSAK